MSPFVFVGPQSFVTSGRRLLLLGSLFEACMEFTRITNPLLIHLTHDNGVKQNCKVQAKKSYNGPKGPGGNKE